MDVGTEIHCQDSLKYLGVVLDSRLSWSPLIKYIAGRSLRAVDVLKAIFLGVSSPPYSFLCN